MVGGLTRPRITLRRIANDAKGWLIRHDLDGLDRPGDQQLRMGPQQVHQTLQGSRRLVLIQPQLEVHAHHSKVITAQGQPQVKRTVAVGGFKLPEHGLGISEDVLWPQKASHGSTHGRDGHLGTDRGGSAFGIRKLLPGADGTPRNEVGDDHANGRLNLLRRCATHCPPHGGRGNGPVNHMVDLVGLETEDFRQTPADFVMQHHAPQCRRAIKPHHLGRGNGHRVKVVVAELTGNMTKLGPIAEVGAVGIPFTHR